MIGRDDLVEMGCYNKPHGINGEISATMLCDLELLDRFKCLVTCVDGIYVPFFVESKRPKTEQTVLLKLDGIGQLLSLNSKLAEGGIALETHLAAFVHIAEHMLAIVIEASGNVNLSVKVNAHHSLELP